MHPKTIAIILALGIVTTIVAMPDDLYSAELARPTAFGLMLAGGVDYWSGDRIYDADGNQTNFSDTGTKSNHLLIPVKFGFHLPCPQWSWYLDLPILAQNYTSATGQITQHDIGMANPWLVTRWIPQLSGGLWLGPRAGLRIAGLSKTVVNITGNTEMASGDNSWGFDLGLLFAYRPTESQFRLDGQAGVRYLFPADYKLSIMGYTLFDYKETPPLSARAELAPGLAWNKSWVSYVKGYATLDLDKGKIHNNSMDLDSDEDQKQLLGAGIRQAWEASPSNEVGLEFDYELSGKATVAGWHLIIDYVGYLPL
jgi:hypothetical protein